MDIETITKKQLGLLPAEVRQAIESVDLPDKIHAIAQKYKLHIDEEGALAEETTLVLWGVVPLRKYTEALETVLDIDQGKASLIAKDIDTALFAPIRDSLIKIGETNAEPHFADNPNEPTPPQIPETATLEMTALPTKEELLAEIENPTPAKQTIVVTERPGLGKVADTAPRVNPPAMPTVAPTKPTPPVIASPQIAKAPPAPAEKTPLRVPVAMPTVPSVQPMPQSILAEKMMGAVQAGKTVVETKEIPTGIKQVEKPKTDPYREVI